MITVFILIFILIAYSAVIGIITFKQAKEIKNIYNKLDFQNKINNEKAEKLKTIVKDVSKHLDKFNKNILDIISAFNDHKISNTKNFKLFLKKQQAFENLFVKSLKEYEKKILELQKKQKSLDSTLLDHDKNTNQRIDIIFNKLKKGFH